MKKHRDFVSENDPWADFLVVICGYGRRSRRFYPVLFTWPVWHSCLVHTPCLINMACPVCHPETINSQLALVTLLLGWFVIICYLNWDTLRHKEDAIHNASRTNDVSWTVLGKLGHSDILIFVNNKHLLESPGYRNFQCHSLDTVTVLPNQLQCDPVLLSLKVVYQERFYEIFLTNLIHTMFCWLYFCLHLSIAKMMVCAIYLCILGWHSSLNLENVLVSIVIICYAAVTHCPQILVVCKEKCYFLIHTICPLLVSLGSAPCPIQSGTQVDEQFLYAMLQVLWQRWKETMLIHRLALKTSAQQRVISACFWFHRQSKSHGQVCSNKEGTCRIPSHGRIARVLNGSTKSATVDFEWKCEWN